MLSGDPRKALPSFERALALDPALAAANYNRAIAWMKLGEHAKASVALAAIAEDADSPLQALAAYHNALALDSLKRPADAEFWLQRALVSDPKLDASHLYLGMLRERRGDVNSAARSYLEYLKRNSESIAAMLRLGIVAHRAGRGDVARTYLQRVVDKSPRSVEAVEARKYLVMWD